ncbi:hypothetical protein OJF2_59370 [Aquisphaera giovannonii]|uniref:Uncharacterized protein n=1 Tax=Aquisphaera giovannonii TaxID=406548 RepID=A0A5B9WA78_9BACT|nr:hypothetical protein [Aquisphaera giovannonii]QEH37347.1 hypothetical protein OJF2_59370 [Aquisphaera giovannonii]
MAQIQVVSVEHPDVPPFPISARLRSQLVYFMSSPGRDGMPALGEGEYWIARDDITRWLMEGVFQLVSPLDTEKATDVELTDEQDAFLNWLEKSRTQHIRVVE